MQQVVFLIYTFLLFAALFPIGLIVVFLQHTFSQKQTDDTPSAQDAKAEKKELGCGCIMMIIGVVPFFILMVGLGICTQH